MPGSRLQVVVAGSLTGPQHDQTREVYYQSFPPQLRVPFADLVVESPADLMLVAVEGKEPVAFAAMLRLRRDWWTFLRYYGVAAGRRRSGLGREFWRLLHPALAEADWPDRIVFEVEDPADAGADAAESRVRAGRIAFWQDCGATLLPVGGYVMPDISGLAEPEPMRLMAFEPWATVPMPSRQVADLVTGLYAERYGLGAADPMVRAAVASVGVSP
jgi:hypothetical protein